MTALRADSIEFGAVGAFDAADISGEFDDRHLEPETQAQIWHLVFAGIADALDFAFGAANAKPAGDDDAVAIGQALGDVAGVDAGGVDPFEIDVYAQMHATMLAGFDDRRVGVAQSGVFAGDGNRDVLAALADAIDELPPFQPGLVFFPLIDALVKIQQRQHFAVDPAVCEAHRESCKCCRHRASITTRRIGTLVYIEIFSRTFSLTGLEARQAMMCGMMPDFHQPLNAELRRLGFLLAERARLQHVRQHDERHRIFALFISELSAGFEISLVFKVTNGAADFHKNHIGVGLGGQFAEAELYFAGDVRE